MGRLYKINPPCPKCHEEHNWWHIQLTDEEQAKMDAYVAASEGKSSLELLLGEPGIVVTRKLKCCMQVFARAIACRTRKEIHLILLIPAVGFINHDKPGLIHIRYPPIHVFPTVLIFCFTQDSQCRLIQMHLINSLILSHGYFTDRCNKILIPVSDFVEFP
mgnify:CR=1 FL=1